MPCSGHSDCAPAAVQTHLRRENESSASLYRPLLAPSPADSAPEVQTLQRLCERCVAHSLVEPRTVLQVLEFADAAGSMALRQHCAEVQTHLC